MYLDNKQDEYDKAGKINSNGVDDTDKLRN